MGKAVMHDFELLIFDLGGVILNIDYRLTQEAFNNLGVKDIDKLYSQASQIDLFDDLEKGLIQPSAFRMEIRDLIGIDVSDEQIDQAWNALLMDLPVNRLDVIARLKKFKKTCLLSNTNEIHIDFFEQDMMANGLQEKFKNCFDQIFYSSRIGMRKPDPLIFRFVMDEFDTLPEKCLFIDDSEQHIRAASELGIHVIHLQKGQEIENELAYLIS
jgi:putative hydrolase of the HAD superfamily